jgi:hypothetical protein
MDDAAQHHKLVYEAVRSGTTGCVIWKNIALEKRVRGDRTLDGLTPTGVICELVTWVRDRNGTIRQKRETRELYRGTEDWVYEVVIPVAGLPRELFVEMILGDPVDKDCPVAVIVSCHLTTFS